jgi:putative membrane protein
MRTIIRTGLFVFTLALAACGGDTDQHGEVSINEDMHDVNKHDMDEANKRNDNDSLESSCSDFVTMAAKDGMMDMEMSEHAYNKASTEPVKVYAKSLMQDHSKMNAELKELAAKKGLVLPTEMEKHDDLENKKGDDLDKSYIDMMVTHHKKTVEMFEDAAEKCDDADIKAYASKNLEILKQHLNTAETISEALKKKDKG